MREDNRLLVIDTKTDTITKILPIEGGPVGVGFAPNGEVWIHNDGDGAVHVIDSAKDEVVRTLKGLGKGAGRMAVSADGRWAASTHGGSEDVALIDAMTKTVVATVPVGKGPGFPIFSPDGSKLYVMNYGMGDIAVIDTATKTGRRRGTRPGPRRLAAACAWCAEAAARSAFPDSASRQ